MSNMSEAITNTISITSFNKGQAGKIFESVKKTGTKVVMKNNKAECVLISPEEYVALMDELEKAKLLAKAYERLSKKKEKRISQEELDKKTGIKESDLKDFQKVDIE